MTIALGLGEYRVGQAEAREWVMYGLGSCVGLIVADRFTRISGAAHIVLPRLAAKSSEAPARYADQAVPFLLAQMRDLGATRGGLFAVMAGGARMFEISDLEDIGFRNSEVVRSALADFGVPLVGADVGGNRGRTLWWDPCAGVARVSQFGREERILTPREYRFHPIPSAT